MTIALSQSFSDIFIHSILSKLEFSLKFLPIEVSRLPNSNLIVEFAVTIFVVMNSRPRTPKIVVLPSKQLVIRTPSKRKVLTSIGNETPRKRRPASVGLDFIKSIEKAFGKKKVPDQTRCSDLLHRLEFLCDNPRDFELYMYCCQRSTGLRF